MFMKTSPSVRAQEKKLAGVKQEEIKKLEIVKLKSRHAETKNFQLQIAIINTGLGVILLLSNNRSIFPGFSGISE